MSEFDAIGSPVPPTSAPGAGLSAMGAISSTQSRNTPAGPQAGSSVGGSRGMAQTPGGTARSLSSAQFPGVSSGTGGA